MEGHSVNHKFLKEFVKERNSNMFRKLIDLESCNLNIVSGSFKTGGEKSNRGLHNVLSEAYQILHDSPARREDYENVSGSLPQPFFLCVTRIG